jgi:hypothetical protein
MLSCFVLAAGFAVHRRSVPHLRHTSRVGVIGYEGGRSRDSTGHVVAYFAQSGHLANYGRGRLFLTTASIRKALDSEGNAHGHILYVVLKMYKADVALVAPSLAGVLTFGARRLREKLGGISALKSADLFRDAIVIAPLVYFAACLIRFNAGPYLIPFLPFVGIFWMVYNRAGANRKYDARLGKRNISWAPIIVVSLLILVAGYRGIEYRFEPILTLQDQDKTFQAVSFLRARYNLRTRNDWHPGC